MSSHSMLARAPTTKHWSLKVALSLGIWPQQRKSTTVSTTYCYRTMLIRVGTRSGTSSGRRTTGRVRCASTCSTSANPIVFTTKVWRSSFTQRRWRPTGTLDGIEVAQRSATTRMVSAKMRRRRQVVSTAATSHTHSPSTLSMKTIQSTLLTAIRTHSQIWQRISTRSWVTLSRRSLPLERHCARPLPETLSRS